MTLLWIVLAYTLGMLVGILIAHDLRFNVNRLKREDETYDEWQKRIED